MHLKKDHYRMEVIALNNQIKPNDAILEILDVLSKSGHSAWCVGGCVRDSILGKDPYDWDITTSAKPDIIQRLFPHTFETGIKHGTVTVIHQGQTCEITTYRMESGYSDSRHPDRVEFTDNIDLDLARRDFTINAIVWNPERGIYDPFHGIADLHLRVIRTVGDAKERFAEDALRMLRAVRFSAQLSFDIEENTFHDIGLCSNLIQNISAERIQSECSKILSSDNPDYIMILQSLGLLKHILGEFTLNECTAKLLVASKELNQRNASIEDILFIRLALVFYSTGDSFSANRIMNKMKYSKTAVKTVTRLVQFSDFEMDEDIKKTRKLSHAFGRDHMHMLFLLRETILLGSKADGRKDSLLKLSSVRKTFDRVCTEKECTTTHQLAIKGNDLISLGLKGDEIGKMQRRLHNYVIENPDKNTHAHLLNLAKQFRNN